MGYGHEFIIAPSDMDIEKIERLLARNPIKYEPPSDCLLCKILLFISTLKA